MTIDRARALPALKTLAAFAFLNAALSFNNGYPTPWIRLDARLAPELVALWLLLLVGVKLYGAVGRRLVATLAMLYLLLVVGRYADVTSPALFGRQINLYADGKQIPRFLAVVTQNHPPWEIALAVAGIVLGFWALYRLLRLAIATLARDAAPAALRSRAALAVTLGATMLVVANAAGVRETWPVVARPVTPTWLRQAELLVTAFSPRLLAARLPPSPPFSSDLAALGGRDVKLVFLESYGATVFDEAKYREPLEPSRAALLRAIEDGGRQVVSAYVRSPTFGGASDLAHLGLLSGIDLSDPLRHDLLLTTDRPTLLTLFRRHGYETFGFYPALSWEWPERAFYGFDRFLDGPGLGYRGPRIGLWWIPDQFAIARFDELNPIGPDTPPRFLFFPTINTHIPFRPVPPYQPDWARVLTPTPFDDAATARSLADEIDWLDLPPAYVRAVEYTYTWLAGYLAQPAPRDYLLILVGDHQPASSVSGEDAPWDVPVHVIASDAGLLERFQAAGFSPGLVPRRPALGAMHELTRVLLRIFDGEGPAAPAAPAIPTGLRLANPQADDETSETPYRGAGS
jgi:hypothetical protein